MKNNILLPLLFLISIVSCTNKNTSIDGQYQKEGLNWLSMNQIEEAIKKTPKPILVDVYTSWCGPCKMLDRKTFPDPAVKAILSDNFHIVKFNAEGNDSYNFQGKEYSNPNYKEGKRGRNTKNELASFFQVRGYPTLAIFDENFKSIGKIVGYRTPEQLTQELQQYIKK